MNNNDILGKGSYGCVIPKKLKCKIINKDIIEKTSNHISKIFTDKKSFKKELNNTLFVNKYDIYNISIKIEDYCIITKEALEYIYNEKGIDNMFLNKCEIPFIYYKELYQIIFDKRGITLKNIISDKKLSLKSLIIYSYNLYKGIKLFNKLNFLHFDIKNDNIIYLPNDYKMIYIDFGLSRSYRDLLKDKSLHYYSSTPRYYYPPELILLSCYYNKYNFKTFKFIYEEQFKYLPNFLNDLLYYNYNNDYNHYINNLKNLYDIYFSTFNPYNIIYKTLDKFDIYSLSITLYYCIERIKLYDNNNEIIKLYYKNIIFPCLNINPYKRTNINKLLYIYNKNFLEFK